MRTITLKKSKTVWASWKATLDFIQTSLTICAIIAAAIWFFIQGTDKPLIHLEQHAFVSPLAGTQDRLQLWVIVTATNLGKTSVTLQSGTFTLWQENPEPQEDAEIDDCGTPSGCPLQNLVLAPGETDQGIVYKTDLRDTYKTVLLKSQYSVPVTFLGVQLSGRKILGVRLPGETEYFWQVETPFDLTAKTSKD